MKKNDNIRSSLQQRDPRNNFFFLRKTSQRRGRGEDEGARKGGEGEKPGGPRWRGRGEEGAHGGEEEEGASRKERKRRRRVGKTKGWVRREEKKWGK